MNIHTAKQYIGTCIDLKDLPNIYDFQGFLIIKFQLSINDTTNSTLKSLENDFINHIALELRGKWLRIFNLYQQRFNLN